MVDRPLQCNSCGAVLEIPAGVRFVTCNHCGARLALTRTVDAGYTERLLEEEVRALQLQVRELSRRQEGEALDREWEREREPLLLHGQVPTVNTCLVVAGAGIALGLWFILNAPGSCSMWLIGLLVIGGAVGLSLWCLRKVQAYESALQAYRQRRAAIDVSAPRSTPPDPSATGQP